MAYLEAIPADKFMRPDDVAALLHVPVQLVNQEIESGALESVKFAGQPLIQRHHLEKYFENAATNGKPAHSGPHDLEINISTSAAFSFKWPGGFEEQYNVAHEGTVQWGKSTWVVRLGETDGRKAAGKLRHRIVVFIDKQPMVEFVGADDYETSQLMASLIKRVDGKQVKPGEQLPKGYDRMNTAQYNSVVTGPYASSNLAVVCQSDDLQTIVKHALLRRGQLDARYKK